ncbi:MAG: AAA-like domain-containing protein [Pseudomonadota bacterium]
MSDQTDRSKTPSAKGDADFFTVGPPLHAVRSGYIERPADTELFDLVTGGRDAYLFAPMRSGKTSLIAATSARLQNNGYLVANLDLAQIGERDAGSDSGRWYYSIAYRLLRQLRIKVDLQPWWQDKSILTSRQRLFEFYLEVLLANTKQPVVVVIDELQVIEDLPFAGQLVESITAVNKARVTEPEFARLTFILSGECDPRRILPDPDMSPFGMMQPVRLGNFTRESLERFERELNLPADAASAALDRIFHWTRGQPYLTQKIARMVARASAAESVDQLVDNIVQQQFGVRASVANEPHLAHIHRRILSDRKAYEASLTMYGRLRKGIAVAYDPDSRPQRALQAVGLIVPDGQGGIAITTPLYELAFTSRWANENLPLHWRGPAIAAGMLILLLSVPFWYTQLLPKPYARILTSSSTDYAAVASAWENLRSFPGHVETADRLYTVYLRNRARDAQTESQIVQVAGYARGLGGADEMAEQFVADFWSRRARQALRNEDRDAALLAVLESFVQATPTRRRLAGSLIGDDYPLLIGTVETDVPQQLVFDSANQLLTLTRGARIEQWAVQAGQLEQRTGWPASALEVTPLLRRVVLDQDGTVSRIGLTVNVSHGRLDDIRMRLIAPSGRAVELVFDEVRSSANEQTRFPAQVLNALRGESLAGTWTLSIRDETGEMAGHLVGWELSLNSQVMVENFDRGLDIPEPVERVSDNLWLSPDGRFAIARAPQSDSARLWNLAYASATRTIAIPAGEAMLGLSSNADQVLTVAQNSIHVWDTRTGLRSARVELGPAQSIQLLRDGDGLLVRRSVEGGTAFEVWDLDSASVTAEIEVAGDAPIAATDPGGTYLAVADYDRAVRVWRIADQALVSQLALDLQPTSLSLTQGAAALAVAYGRQGFSLWRTDRGDAPILDRREEDDWFMAFSSSGGRFVAGSASRGYQIFRPDNGRAIGPPLDSGFSSSASQLLAFSDDGNVVLTANDAGRARFWRFPTAAAALAPADTVAVEPGRRAWRLAGEPVAALSPDGQRLAVGDADGHVRFLDISTVATANAEELNFIGHRGAVTRVIFSDDGSLVASVGRDNRVRVWESASGSPRRFDNPLAGDGVDVLRFSPDNRLLAILTGQEIRVIATESGVVEARVDVGDVQNDVVFGAENRIFLAGMDGSLRRLAPDRLGDWSLETVWQGTDGLRRLAVGPNRRMMVLADVRNVLQVFDIEAGSIGTALLELPDDVSDVVFGRSDAQVFVRTSRWVHRAEASSSGLHWRNAIRAPAGLPGTRLVVNRGAAATLVGSRTMLLTREAGFVEVADLDFSHASGSMLFGEREQLLDEWRSKLGPNASLSL